jgi:predicted amidohydrolase YtcJ
MKRTMSLVLAATAALVNPGCAQTRSGGAHPQGEVAPAPADLVLTGGVIHTQAKAEGMPASTSAIAVRDGRIVALGDAAVALADDAARVVDLAGRTVIPGLDDSHLHAVRGGRFYNLELRWDGVPSLAVGLERIREQAARTPDGHWVRVVGGWSPFQFEERRMPTVQELNAAAPHTPVFVLFLYSKGFLNRAAVEALGLTEDTPPRRAARQRPSLSHRVPVTSASAWETLTRVGVGFSRRARNRAAASHRR